MQTIKIRDVRGAVIERLAETEQLVGVTNNRLLVAVLIPVNAAWLEHLVEENLSRIRQNVEEGEQELEAGELSSLDKVLEDAAASAGDAAGASRVAEPLAEARAHGAVATAAGGMLDVAACAARVGVLGPANGHVLNYVGRIRDALGLQTDAVPPTEAMATIRVGDLSGQLIERAGIHGQVLAVTNDRVLVGLLFPVTAGLVEHLIEQNLSRIEYNIARGEREILSGRPLTTLEDSLEGDQEVEAAEAVAAPGRYRHLRSHFAQH